MTTEAWAPLWGLVPIKEFTRAKSRLSPVLDPRERVVLAQRLCEHVIVTLLRCPGIAGVLVISDSAEVLTLARRCGADAERQLPAPARPPLSVIIDDGLQRLERRGAQAALVVMSDLPSLRVQELAALVALLPEQDWVVAPDVGGRNTNALLLRLAGRVPTAFGTGDSFRLHTEGARAAGLRVAVHHAPGLALDVDLPEDYAHFMGSCAAGSESGGPG